MEEESDDPKAPENSSGYAKDGFVIQGYMDPPKVPERGFSVPSEIVKLAADLRKRVHETPESVPQRWMIWFHLYSKEHPYGFKMRERREAHFSETNEISQTTAEIEKVKGKKHHKILNSFSVLLPLIAKEMTAAFKAGGEAYGAGRMSATADRKVGVEEMKAAFEALKTTLETVTGIAETAYSTRQDDLDDRVELIRLLRDAQGALPEKSELWGKIGAVAVKLAQVAGPALGDKLGFDIAALLPAKEAAPEVPQKGKVKK